MVFGKKKQPIQYPVPVQLTTKPMAYIPMGDFEIVIKGIVYTQERLHKLYFANTKWFSLTPRNRYQREHAWPDRGCINVNYHGSKITDENNWLGYFIPEWKSANVNSVIGKMVDKYELSVSGIIEIAFDGSYQLKLLLPIGYIARYEIKLTRDNECRNNIEELIKANITKPTGILIFDIKKKRYCAMVENKIIGYSSPKVTEGICNYLASGTSIFEALPATMAIGKRNDSSVWSVANIGSNNFPLIEQ